MITLMTLVIGGGFVMFGMVVAMAASIPCWSWQRRPMSGPSSFSS